MIKNKARYFDEPYLVNGGKMLSCADKDLLVEFLDVSHNRIILKSSGNWEKSLPQGVSVYRFHKDNYGNEYFEYLFTKQDKFDVELDHPNEIEYLLNKEFEGFNGELIFYMNKCMVNIANKHIKYPF